MIDFASTREGVSPTVVPYLRMMTAIVAQAVEDASLKWKVPKYPTAAYKLIAKRNKEGLAAVDPVELEFARGKAKRYTSNLSRAKRYEDEAQMAMRFLLSRGGGMDVLAEIIGFDAEDFRQALLYGRDDPSGKAGFCGHDRMYRRAHLWVLHPERWSPVA